MRLNLFLKVPDRKPKAVIFISGSGTNAEKLLESLDTTNPTWEASVILSDNPNSRADFIAKKYGLPLIIHDIRSFYLEKGEKSISLMTEKGRSIREEWTDKMRELLKPYKVDFGILAGFVSLTNICADFPCLNIHPGDLTVESQDHKRLLVGLHTIPIETAILAGHKYLRSSVIIAQPYTGKGGEMDSGPILGISEPVAVELDGITVNELCEIRKKRPTKKPPGGFNDILEELSKKNQEKLKRLGDWTLFPPVVSDFAAGMFRTDDDGNLYYKNSEYIRVKTVIYKSDGTREPILS